VAGVELAPGERIVFEGHPSWRSTLGWYVEALLAVAFLVGIAALAGVISWVLVAVVGVLAVVGIGWLKRAITVYVVTDRRLHIQRGLLMRRTQQTDLERVQNVNTSQSLWQRVLQIGTVDFDTAAGDDYDFRFAGVADPGAVVEAVDRARRS
jgi:uncharacterized membrane protein YdbT with pleckstrin-like domain